MKSGDPVIPGLEPEIAPGVRGILFDLPAGIYIPMIAADNPGNGDVSKYLDTLPRDKRVVFPTVVAGRLLGMLQRRGFVATTEWSDSLCAQVDIMERLPAP